MRWPSEIVGDFADKLEGIEDAAYDRYVGARAWLGGWKVWEWHEQQKRIESLRNSNRLMVEEYEKLRELYREKTGHEPPTSTIFVFANVEGYEQSMALMREAMRKMHERMYEAFGLSNRQGKEGR
ncbi:MAG: hypothetical protein M3R38_21450 [Actinomycetota bacterium]|nr:hypothetical protein [Actinomycetota bacterium]